MEFSSWGRVPTEERAFLTFCKQQNINKPSNVKRAGNPSNTYHFRGEMAGR